MKICILRNLIAFCSVMEITNGHLLCPNRLMNHPEMVINQFSHDIVARYHRSLATDKEKQLQHQFFNWNMCTNAATDKNFTPMNSLVPENTIFLATSPEHENASVLCVPDVITKTGTIKTGIQTIFFPIYAVVTYDYDDDWELGICAATKNETKALRYEAIEAEVPLYENETITNLHYAKMDGKDIIQTFIYDTDEFYYSACPDDPTKTYEEYDTSRGYSGDTCDTEPYQVIGGLDAYPFIGLYGIDTREWVDGETHTYEFGTLYSCQTGKYILTAQSDATNNLPRCGFFFSMIASVSLFFYTF